MAELFGFQIKRKREDMPLPAVTRMDPDDGSLEVAAGGMYGTVVDLDGTVRSEAELIDKYRQMSEHPEVDSAIDDITNEAITVDQQKDKVSVDLTELMMDDKIKDAIVIEFNNILQLLEFNTYAYDIFRRFYIDGRLYYEAVIDPKMPDAGIQELRYIDPRKIRKVKEVKRKREQRTGVLMPEIASEYYVYNEKGFTKALQNNSGNYAQQSGIRIAKDAVVHIISGMMSAKGDMVLSHLHKAIKPLNQLRTMEDSLVIYRISRAPERRVFYIDVGNLPKMKAEQYVKDIMTRFKNRIVYDSATGDIRDDRKFMTMLEDFWLPRREGGKGTEISVLPGGQNLGQMDDVTYFQQKLYRSLNVPVTRMETSAIYGTGRATEVSRDEVKFSKFIDRLHVRFAMLFSKILERQLILKKVITPDDWYLISDKIQFVFAKDNFFQELKNSEILTGRLNLLNALSSGSIGKYYSHDWVRRNVLMQTDEDVKMIDQQILVELQNPIYNPPPPPPENVPGGSQK